MEAQSSYARAVNTVATRMGHLLVDRSAEFGTPPAAGPPTACVIPGLGVHNIAYRDTSGQLHELWRDAQGITGTTNLTANAGAPPATGNPFAYVDTSRNTEILLFRGDDGTVHSLYWSTGRRGPRQSQRHRGAPPAAGDPVGYYAPANDTHNVIYRSGDGHLHSLYWVGVAPVIYGGNLTWAISAPPAAGDPTAFINAAGVNIVVYRSVHGEILSLYWTDGPSGLDNLSGVAGTPPAAGDPVAYYTAHDDTHQVVYRGRTGTCGSSIGRRRAGGRLESHAALGRPGGDRHPRGLLQRRHEHQARHLPRRRRRAARALVGARQRDPAHVDLTAAYGGAPAADHPRRSRSRAPTRST